MNKQELVSAWAHEFEVVHRSIRDPPIGAAVLILDEASLTGRLIADQLGHARPSMTQDVYMGRRAVDSRTAQALEAALRDAAPDEVERGKSVANEEGQRTWIR